MKSNPKLNMYSRQRSMKSLRPLALAAALLIGSSAHSFAQTVTPVSLALVDSTTGLSVETITPGDSFSLNIEASGLSTAMALDSFSVAVSGSTTAITAFASGINLANFSNLEADFYGNSEGGFGEPQVYTAAANETSDDITSPLPTSLVTANFTTSSALAPGTYAIDFPPAGIVPSSGDQVSASYQELFDPNGNTIAYNPVEATILVVPEANIVSYLLIGLSAMAGFRLMRPMFRRI
jgi:hypothetical protein